MTADRRAALAKLLTALRREGRQIEQADRALVPETLAEAYAVQADVARRVPGGTRGWKVGMTSEAAMRARGRTEPVYARLFTATTFYGHGHVPTVLGRRMFEAEYVFELRRDLPKQDHSRDALIDAIGAARPGIEICGSRFSTDDSLDLFLSLADNSFHLGLVIGDPIEDWQDGYLDETVTITDGDGREGKGSGRDVLGDPLNALRWLANVDLPDRGLKAGDLVATGVAAKLDVLTPSASARARFGGRGEISADLA